MTDVGNGTLLSIIPTLTCRVRGACRFSLFFWEFPEHPGAMLISVSTQFCHLCGKLVSGCPTWAPKVSVGQFRAPVDSTSAGAHLLTTVSSLRVPSPQHIATRKKPMRPSDDGRRTETAARSFFHARRCGRGMSSTTPYATPRREYPYVASEGSGGCEDFNTFSYMTGGEQDAPVELRIGDTLYRLDSDDLLAFARAIGGKG